MTRIKYNIIIVPWFIFNGDFNNKILTMIFSCVVIINHCNQFGGQNTVRYYHNIDTRIPGASLQFTNTYIII